MIKCLLTTYRSSRNRFYAVIICTIVEYFLPVSWYVLFLTKWPLHFGFEHCSKAATIVPGRISSLHMVFLISRTRCHYRITNARNIRETAESLAHRPHYHLLTDMCSFCSQRCGPRPKLFYRLDIYIYFFKVQGCSHSDFYLCALYCYKLTRRTREF